MTNRSRVDVNRQSLERLVSVARSAGAAAMRFYGAPGAIELKSDATPVTAADRAAQAVIARALHHWDDSVPVISEEAAAAPFEERCSWRRFWLVDPLDGTKEFLAGNGEFTVNIALIDAGEPVLGVVFAPALDTVYFAGRGLGAWKVVDGGRPTSVSADRNAGDVLRVVESRSHPSAKLEAFIATLGRVERIPLGSSLKFCRIAEGGADLYPRFGPTMEWDVAAGDCVYRNSAAGGRQRPSSLRYNQRSLTIQEFVIGDAVQSLAVDMGSR